MTKKIIPLILLVLTTSSCMVYHINSVDTSDDFYPPKSAKEVIYLEDIDDLEGCTDIGTVTVNGERKQRNIDDVLLKMKREAAVLGGDVITDIRSDATGAWKSLPAQEAVGNAYVRANYMAAVFLCGDAVQKPAAKTDTIMIKASEVPLAGETQEIMEGTSEDDTAIEAVLEGSDEPDLEEPDAKSMEEPGKDAEDPLAY